MKAPTLHHLTITLTDDQLSEIEERRAKYHVRPGIPIQRTAYIRGLIMAGVRTSTARAIRTAIETSPIVQGRPNVNQ
jgi:hypothetical protein